MDPRSAERGQYRVRAIAHPRGRLLARSHASDRKARHLAAARHFETLADQELAGALAAHYLAAYRNASEGVEADALAAQARVSLRGAGDRAVALGAQEQALGFFREAFEVTSEPAERAVLLERAGQAASAAGLHQEAEPRLNEAIDLFRSTGDRSGVARVTGLLGDELLGQFRADAAIAVLEPASKEFADLGDDSGLAYLLGQLARCQMLRQADLRASIATADLALALAERLDRVDLVADVLVTRGTALTSLGRGYEGLGCLETGLRLAQRHSLLPIEIRARMNLGGPLTDSDPRAAYDVSRGGLEVARRVGRALALSMLTGNASVGAKEVGEWAWALEQVSTPASEAATSVEQRMTLLGFEVEFLVEQGMPATSEDRGVRGLAPVASHRRAVPRGEPPFFARLPRHASP